jgi:hypothetical protein
MADPKFNIVLLCPPGYGHSLTYWEVGLLLEAGLSELGHRVTLQSNRFEADATNILLGYHLLGEADARAILASGLRYIPYQLEQFSPESTWITPTGLQVLRGAAEVWEYSRPNLAILASQGVGRVRYLPLGYHSTLELIRPLPEPEKTIDVLHYGSFNLSRRHVLSELRKHCRVEELLGVYGAQRDAAIAQSRLVLHVHYFEAKLAAQVRVSYLLNNAVAVVSEASADEPFAGMIATAPYGELVEACLRLLRDPDERQRLAREGHDKFRQLRMVDHLRAVLADRPS